MGLVAHLFSILLWLSRPFLVFARRCWDRVVRSMMSLAIIWKRKIPLPPVFNPILMLPAKTIAEQIRQRKLKSVEVVRGYMTRISDINPILNAIVQENFQEALDEARKVDQWIDEAALMCACGSPISIGTDIGGSIRTPAFFCGLFGHKPSVGIVSTKGCNVHGNNIDSAIQVAGPITRFAVDLAPLLTVIAGNNAKLLRLQEPVHVNRLKMYTIEGDSNGILTSSVDQVLLQAQRDVCKHFLHEYDVTVNKVYLPELCRSFWIWQEKYLEDYPDESPIYQQLVDNKGEINVFTEMIRWALFRARYSFPSLLQAVRAKIYDEVAFLKTQRRVLQGSEGQVRPKGEGRWIKLKMRLQRLLGEDGILIYPSHPTQAPYHRESYYHPLNFTYTAIFNALGFPVTQVPLGLDQVKGLPVGIQVVGGLNQDRLTIAVAKDLEVKFGGWRCPAKIL